MHTVKLTVGERTLRFDLACLLRLETEQGINAFNLPDTSPKTMLGMLWAGLLHQQPDLKLKDVLPLVPLADVVAVNAAVMTAYRDALPQKQAEETPATGDGS